MKSKRDLEPKLTCPENCGYATRSETQFTKHLIEVHACREHVAARLTAKAAERTQQP